MLRTTVVFNRSTRAAIVVVTPEPTAPVRITSPSGACASSCTAWGMPSSSTVGTPNGTTRITIETDPR